MTRRKRARSKVKKSKASAPYGLFVNIVSDGWVGDGSIALGVPIPVLFLDASQRTELDDVIEAHTYDHLDNGDVETRWMSAPDDHWIGLDIKFKRPIETRAIIRFPMPKYGILVHQALKSKAVYIHSARPGVEFGDYYDPSTSPNQAGAGNSRPLLISLPHGGFERVWESKFRAILFEHFRKRALLPKSRARKEAEKLYARIDELSDIRVLRNPNPSGKGLYLKAADFMQAAESAPNE